MDPANPILIDQKLAELWIIAALLALFSYFATRWRPWLGAAVIIMGLVATSLMFLEIADPASSVGMELALGRAYVVHTRIASIGLFVLPALASLVARRTKLSVV